ncbi:MAG TPA: hypothetical protein VEA99_17920 [Gemmatimonadaceae bacterium]|nr:hypothetical protein [Gemmatimonadaceae bacterium]
MRPTDRRWRAALVGVGAALLLAAAPLTLRAQARRDPPPPRPPRDSAMAVDTRAMEAMGPMMGEWMTSMMQPMLVALARPETVDRLATFTRGYHEALVAKDFTREEALRIVAAHGIPRPQPGH